MLIIGELINASRKEIAAAIRGTDATAIRKIAKDQAENGADFIDVNAGVFLDQEAEYLTWLVREVQSVTQKPCCVDSPNPQAIEAALSVHEGPAMINSISLEQERLNGILPLIAGTGHCVIALCTSDDGIPETADDRLVIAEKLINKLTGNHIPLENIYVDPLAQSVSTNTGYGMECLNAIQRIMRTFAGCHTVCGVSNISYGLPDRQLLNRTYMAMAIAYGLDAAIINPLDTDMTRTIRAAGTLAGTDNFCMNYIKAWREKQGK